LFHCRIQLSLLKQGSSQSIMRLSRIRLDLQGLGVLGDSCGKISAVYERKTQVCARERIISRRLYGVFP